MAEYDYDLFVIGAGSGGVRAARVAAGLGARVAIAESDRPGGTCVIRGCVPKKLLVYAARFREDFDDAAAYGWNAQATFSWPTLIANKDREIARLEDNLPDAAQGGRRRAGRRARDAGRPSHGAGRRAPLHGGAHPGRHGRAAVHACHSGQRARDHLRRGLPAARAARSRADVGAPSSRSSSPGSSTGSAPGSRWPTAASRSCEASTMTFADTCATSSCARASTCGC